MEKEKRGNYQRELSKYLKGRNFRRFWPYLQN